MAELIDPMKSLRVMCPACKAPPRAFRYRGWGYRTKYFECTECKHRWEESK